MTMIKVSDTRLASFYTQNPDFDILQFDLLNGQADTLDWADLDPETTLELLKQYQRLLRINPNPEIAQRLLNETAVRLDSAHAIASMTEAQFIKLLPEDKAVAKQMYQKAIDIKARTQLLWANMKDAVASPHFRSMRVSATQDDDNTTLSHTIPSYQEIFGDLDYFDCDHSNSVLSPAAYLVDLIWIVDQYITEPNQDSINQAGGLTLNQRRPDLAEIELSAENTNSLLPALQMINRILEARVKATLDSEDALQSLATEQYPFALPVNYPLEQIRSYLSHLGTDLASIYEVFDVSELAIAREHLGLSLEDYDLITQPETTKTKLKQRYGVEQLEDLNSVETFLQHTGLSRLELSELLEQNLHQSELDAGLAHTFYINQGLEDDQAVRFSPDGHSEVASTLDNLNPATLDRIHRFIRLSRKLGWSLTDLDWVLTSIGATEIDEAAIHKISKIKHLQATYKIPIDVLCSFWHDMKAIGLGENPQQPQDLFNRVFNNPFKEMLGDSFVPLQDEIHSLDLSHLSQEVENNPVLGRISAALQLNVNQLTSILQVLWREAKTVDLTVENLSQIFRLSQILRLLGLDIESYQVLLNFLNIESASTISIAQLCQITELAEWLQQYRLTLEELDYVISGHLSPNLEIGYSDADVMEGMKALWQLAASSLFKPSDLVGKDIDEKKALSIFEQLLANDYIEDVTGRYEMILEVPLDTKLAIVRDSQISDNAALIQDISSIIDPNEQSDPNQHVEQINGLQAILQTAIARQAEELAGMDSFLAIEADLVLGLLEYTATATQTPDYIKFLLTPVSQDPADWSEILDFFQFLSRVLVLTEALKLTPTELQCISENPGAFDMADLSQPSLRNIQTIQRFKGLIAVFGDDKDKWADYFSAASSNDADQSITALAQISGWQAEQISQLFAPEETQANNRFNLGSNLLQTVDGIDKLNQCFNLSRQLGVNVSGLTQLLQLENLTVAEESENWDIYRQTAHSVKEMTKAHYNDEAWADISEQLEGELSQRKRDILAAWVIWKHDYENLRHLSQELLIDVETSSEVSISIIKEAILAIQTYLHRCQMGLEPGVENLEIPENWWQWMMNYRIWEANRKIFLYPENYLDPSLRQRKSPIFQEFEEALLQSDITPESVEKAYQNYFEQFNEIAQLKLAGGYRCTVEKSSAVQDTLYLFGRTATEPYTYYFRKCINPESNTPTWEAWEKIDLVINSEHINATYAFNKLFIFWVEVVQIETEKQSGNNQSVKTETKATIKYSFQKFGNQWIQPQTLAKDIVIEDYDQLSETLWRKVTALPIPAKGSEPEKILTLFGDLTHKNNAYRTQDNNQGICLSVDLQQEQTSVTLADQPASARQSAIFDGQLMAISTENVLYDNHADYADDSTRRSPLMGLAAYWSMHKQQGNQIVDPVGDREGLIKGNALLTSVPDFPRTGARNVLQLDGNGDYVELTGSHASFGNFGDRTFSISLWFRTTATSGTLFMGAGGDDNYWRIYLEKGLAKFAFNTGKASGSHGSSEKAMNDGKWHHVTAIRKAARSGELYIDGALVDTWSYKSSTTGIDKVSAVFIGTNKGKDYFKGQIAEVSVWNLVLNAEQVRNTSIPFIPLITENVSSPNVSVQSIDNQPGWFTFDSGEEAFLAVPEPTNGLRQIDQGLKSVTQEGNIALAYNVPAQSNQEALKYTFTRLTTSTIRQFSQKMLMGGIDNFLTLESQLTPELNFNRFSPEDLVDFSNHRQLDFDGPLGLYFWEIFFHIPFLVAHTLNANQRFEEAQKWYHYIFNPTTPQYIFEPNTPQYIFNPTNPDASGLAAYWPMDEGKGKEIGTLAGKTKGTFAGTPQWKSVEDFPGGIARAVLDFDGEQDAVQIDKSVGDFKADDFSIQLWFKTAAASGALIGGGIPASTDYWQIYLEDGFARFGFNTGGLSGHHSRSKVTVNDGYWHHIAAVRDQSQGGKLYLDGVLVDEFQYRGKNTAINIPSQVFLGKNANDINFFRGQIAEVSIWNVALSAEQVFDGLFNEFSTQQGDRFWHYLPFRGNTLHKLEETFANDGAIAAYNDNPFDPHAIARLRIGAYEKAIVMKYIDNLLDWGDQLFAQDNRESINQATLLYFLAYDLLGEEPENLGKRRSQSPKTVQQLQEHNGDEADQVPQFLINLENRVTAITPATISDTPFNALNSYFCTPENEQFIAYWQRVEDRLYKIRHSLSIEGIRRQLALFQPAIDPAQLIRAVAGGIQPLSVVSQLTPAVPNYRFDNILERAKSFTSTLTQLGNSLLSALEKKDAEELALLRSSHEQSILQLLTTTKEQQLGEANEVLSSLNESLASAQQRHHYYHTLLKNGLYQNEQLSQNLLVGSLELQALATGVMSGAAIAYMFPTIFGLASGGHNQGAAISSASGALSGGAYALSTASSLADKVATYDRRDEEWEFQAQLAETDVQQIEHQIEAQKIRVQIAEQDLKIHEKNIEQAQEIEAFLQGKFTNQELYQWMVSRLSILYFQTYKLALDMAMATQSAYQYELTKEDTFINFGYWDSLKKGLLAGESLMLSLNQLEKAYIEGNTRRFEIEKTISLLQLNPIAFQQLKDTGTCEFELSEKLFDLDFPGHYARQIKTMAVAIPAVVGPYQNISATLTQTSNKTLLKPDTHAVEYLLEGGETLPDSSILRSNWRQNQKVALSRGAMDNGLFELNFFWDTRYLPFEATGAVSSWKLELPKQNNRIDFDTISDVVITLSYTALDGGEKFRQEVTELDALQSSSESYYFDFKQSFPGEWHTFMNLSTDTESQKLNFHISSEILPPQTQSAKLTGVVFKLDAPEVVSPLTFATMKMGKTNVINKDHSINKRLADDWFGDWVIDFDLNQVPEALKKDGLLNSELVKNIVLILMYERS